MYTVVSEEFAASFFRIELAYKPSFLPESTNFNPKHGGNISLKKFSIRTQNYDVSEPRKLEQI
jgi:hypothetical protein